MLKQMFKLSVCALLISTSCMAAEDPSVLNAFPVNETSDKTELVWIGTGSTNVYEDGEWISTPTEDYTFMVYQKRYEDQWKSHKIMNRVFDNYSGAAGDVDQQHLFVVSYDQESNHSRNFDILSTMGNGEGVIDSEYENATMFIDAGISKFAPYSHIRLIQKYDYDEGTLNEVIELVKLHKDSSETPYMRIIETASLFRN